MNNIALILTEQNTARRGVESSLYTLTRTHGLKLFMLYAGHTDEDGVKYLGNGDGSHWWDEGEDGVEFWATSEATALDELRRNVAAYKAAGLTYMSEEGLDNTKVRAWVNSVAPKLLDLSTYGDVAAVVTTDQHVRYVVRKMAELVGSLEDSKLMDLLQEK